MHIFSVVELAQRRYSAGCVIRAGLHLCDALNGSATALQENCV